MLVAHTPGPSGEWHPLAEHLNAVAEIAAAHAARFDGDHFAWWAGLLHDVGKASPEFQRYLQRCAAQPGRRFASTDHKSAGAVQAIEFADLLAFVVLGHHGGMPDREGVRLKLKERATDAQVQTALARCRSGGLIPDPLPLRRSLPLPALLNGPDGKPDYHEIDFFLRLLFSALVDADHADTERHFEPDTAAARNAPLPSLGALADALRRDQDALLAASATSATDGQPRTLHAARETVYRACLAAAPLPPGFFRLTVPTGGGKTRSSLAFALEHARRHNLERVIVAVPYLTITDQTADVYRRIFGDERALLEHHSGVVARQTGRGGAGRDDARDGAQDREATWRRLATQDWNAPIVVTTTVQLFESLFANTPASCRKLHRLVRSVVVLDEAQTLPLGLLDPILDALHSLVAGYSSSVVLCTATQPALDDAPGFRGLPGVREIVPDPPALYQTLSRVTYEWPAGGGAWSWEDAAAAMREESQVLCIVNTRADALALHAALADAAAIHLSTLLCQAHRRELLQVVRNRLRRGAPVRLVSTQVVEAGVDLDFPLVLRALGPLDSIVQAAGRCNREARLATGRVVVFQPAEGSLPPGAYRAGAQLTASMLGEGPLDLDDPATFDRYYRQLYGMLRDFDTHKIQDLRADFAFPAVDEKFRMIEDDTVPVIVPYTGPPPEQRADLDAPAPDHAAIVAELIDHLSSPDRDRGSPRRLLQRAQPYVVNRRRRDLDADQQQGLVRELREDVFAWEGGYDARGIVSERTAADYLW